MSQAISSLEWTQISSRLEMHHALFYQLWQMGRPIFDESLKTAAVRFNEEGHYIEFVFNPDFWEMLTPYERLFIICHESLHIIFNHGIRSLTCKENQRANIAMDIVVNHTLINSFGFDRKELTIDNKLCWLGTVFLEEQVEPNKSFEYYYQKLQTVDLVNLSGGNSGDGLPVNNSIDQHESLSDVADSWGDVVSGLDESLSQEEKQAIKDLLEKHTENETSQTRGTASLGAWSFVNPGKVTKKRKWETVIKKWSRKYMKRDLDSVEQWARLARRFALLPSDLMLPSEVDHDSWSQDRIQVWFFQDCSGSCIGLKNRFFRAARSLPKERFDVKMHTFDTRVFEVNINDNKIRGGGGTSFTCMERYIQSYIKQHRKDYPLAIFVITDGYGDRIRPQKPENWFWFLSTRYRSCIPSQSNVFQLSDFE